MDRAGSRCLGATACPMLPAAAAGPRVERRVHADHRDRLLVAGNERRPHPPSRHLPWRIVRRHQGDAGLGSTRFCRCRVVAGRGSVPPGRGGADPARGSVQRADPRGQGGAAGAHDRARAGRLRVRHGSEHGGLVPPQGERARGHPDLPASRRDAQPRRHPLHGQPASRCAARRVPLARRRSRGGTSLHLPRVPLCRVDRTARCTG